MHSLIENKRLYYSISPQVEAFSTQIGAELPYPVIQPHQTHTDTIAIIDRPDITRGELEGIDALITNLKGVAIGVRTADCVPILLYDPVQQVVAAIHSGWRGTVARISQKTIAKMHNIYGTQAQDLISVIGPSISLKSFQVGIEVVEQFAEAGFLMDDIHKQYGNHVRGDLSTGDHVDLWEANRYLLKEAGVGMGNIYTAGICTFLDEHYHSARRETNNKCERIINSIKIV